MFDDDDLLCHRCQSVRLEKRGTNMLYCPACGAKQLSSRGYHSICLILAIVTGLAQVAWAILWLFSGSYWFRNVSLVSCSMGVLAVLCGTMPKRLHSACGSGSGRALLRAGVLSIVLQAGCLLFFLSVLS